MPPPNYARSRLLSATSVLPQSRCLQCTQPFTHPGPLALKRDDLLLTTDKLVGSMEQPLVLVSHIQKSRYSGRLH
ncbi:hypothetical protein P175DRAFT_0497259 [Aspergillus ochraceoroseus IBT 24754]|uniref:Uncharacterized protein n=1 Tax=Aspergillus ochraceoroseus IBT 24754 TaxID=1392256 RepID=A0A2T5M6I0_9EURO|nr:uncharacterized protein P175DRAFT_0497259 [Aspergillus ochraceoroseus IBT 24754]PTU24140.1 hypothetical protein P175DRAFT_0497259 [Aspergillus ochraceoroseus IBT 24754]